MDKENGFDRGSDFVKCEPLPAEDDIFDKTLVSSVFHSHACEWFTDEVADFDFNPEDSFSESEDFEQDDGSDARSQRFHYVCFSVCLMFCRCFGCGVFSLNALKSANFSRIFHQARVVNKILIKKTVQVETTLPPK
jgi:hypothetical protein